MLHLRLAVPLLAVLALAACSSSNIPGNKDTVSGTAAPVSGEKIQGKSTDMVLKSNVDGANIAFTIHEPAEMVAGGHYPLILQSHGYGGKRENAAARGKFSTPLYQSMIDSGYGLISIDERGFGQSGGKVRILDPDFEGQDLLQVMDWAEQNLPWLMYRDGNLVVGATGGSYGGGFQHLIYAIDPKHRLDAIAPEITWHDLRYSLYSGTVFKSFWASLLSAAGNSAGGQDSVVNEGLAEGLGTNRLSDDKTALLYRNSLASYCEGKNTYAMAHPEIGPLTKIDALYWQSAGDTLFNLNDAAHNFQCVSALGGDVRILVKTGGHDSLVGGGSGEACGKLVKNQSILDWYDEKLKGMAGKASYIPKYCFHLGVGGEDGVITSTLPVGGKDVFQVPAQTLIAQEGSQQAASIVLTKIGADGAILAGIPTIHLKVTDPSGLKAGDPILFISLAKRAAGAASDTLIMANQTRPFRGFTEGLDDELTGVSVRLAPNDEVRLRIQAAFAPRYPKSGSAAATPVNVEATINLPLQPANLPAAPANTGG